MNIRNNYNFYKKNGYVVVRNLISKTSLKKIFLELEKIKKKAILSKRENYHLTQDNKLNTIHNVNKFYKKSFINNISKNKKILKIVNFFLNNNSKVRNIEFFLKPKKTGMPSPFHQDNFYWNIINAEALNVWIALSKSGKFNGGVCYFEESHQLGILKHKVSHAKGSSQKIPTKILKKLNFKKKFPILKPGDCIIHHPEVIHGSNKNISNFDRAGLVISYMKKNARIDLVKVKQYKNTLKKTLKEIYN